MRVEDLELTLRAFQESRILLTAVELNVFTALESGATAGEAARRLGTKPRATTMLLNALAALGLLHKTGEVFANEPLAASLLSDHAPDSARTAMLHLVHRWNTWSRLTNRVRGVAPPEDYRALAAERHEAFLAMQDRRSTRRAPDLVAAIGTEGVQRILDVGGGSAAYSIAFARLSPKIEAEVLELPEILPMTRRYLAASGVEERVRARPCDILSEEFGSGYDLILVCSVAHLLGEGENQSLLDRCYRALAPGGRVAIYDHILAPCKTTPRAGAIFALNMLVATPHGATYSFDEYESWLNAAGFREVRRGEIAGPLGLILGFR